MMPTTYRSHPAWTSPVMLKFAFSSLFVGVAFCAAAYFSAKFGLLSKGYAALGVLVLIGFCYGSAFLYRNRTLYVVNARGVALESGFPVRTNKREISFQKMSTVNVSQSLVEKLLLKTGTVTICTPASDPSNDDIAFIGIKRPHFVAEMIRDGEDRHGSSSRPAGADYWSDRSSGGYGGRSSDPYGDSHRGAEQDPYGRPSGPPPRWNPPGN